MLAPFLRIFRTPGAWRFSLAGFIARLPISMAWLAISLLIIRYTESYTLTGTVGAASAVTATIGAPMWSRAADRLGQRRILRICVPFYIGFNLLFLWLITHDASTWKWATAIIVAELFSVNTGQLVRSRWFFVLRDNRELFNAALSFEAFVDEVIFISGPLIVTTAVSLINPSAGLLFAVAFMAIGVGALFRDRESEPPLHPKVPGEKHELIIKRPDLLAIFVPFIFIGAALSSIGLTVTAYGQLRNSSFETGMLWAVWALGSGVAALVNGSRHFRISLGRRFLYCIGLFFLSSLPLLVSTSSATLFLALFINGMGISPLIVAGYSLAEQVVPPQYVTEALTWTVAGLIFGGSLPGTLTGHIIDHYGTQRAFLVPVFALLLGGFTLIFFAKRWKSLVLR